MYGHVLVWHSQTPAWFFQDDAGQPLTTERGRPADPARPAARRTSSTSPSYLSDTYGEFGSDTNPLVAFDVVNEVVSDSGEFADGLRRSEWYRILGEEFIDLAFRYADEAFNDEYAAAGADRPVTLFINDYNTEQGGKQARYTPCVERLLERGVPVDGVGHQFHVSLAMPVSALEAALAAFEDLPVMQAVTELDVTTGTPVTRRSSIDQGYYFRDAFRVFREHADDLFSVTVWGLTDGRSWRIDSGAPLVFDDGSRPSPPTTGPSTASCRRRSARRTCSPGDVPLTPTRPPTPEWAQLPLHDDRGRDARFQLRWAPDHLTAFVTVDDATVRRTDAVDVRRSATQTFTVGRDGSGDVDGVVDRARRRVRRRRARSR